MVLQGFQVPDTILQESSPSKLSPRVTNRCGSLRAESWGTERRGDDVTGDGGDPFLPCVQEPFKGICPTATRPKKAAGRNGTLSPGPSLGPPKSTYLLRSVIPDPRVFQRPRAERQPQAQPQQQEHGGVESAAVALGRGGTRARDSSGAPRPQTCSAPPPRPSPPRAPPPARPVSTRVPVGSLLPQGETRQASLTGSPARPGVSSVARPSAPPSSPRFPQSPSAATFRAWDPSTRHPNLSLLQGVKCFFQD